MTGSRSAAKHANAQTTRIGIPDCDAGGRIRRSPSFEHDGSRQGVNRRREKIDAGEVPKLTFR